MPIKLIEPSVSQGRLAELEREAGNGHSASINPETADVNEAVRVYTASLFSGSASVKEICDPDAGDRSFLVTVEADGSVEELVQKSDRWHRELHFAAGDQTHLYGLSIIPLDESE